MFRLSCFYVFFCCFVLCCIFCFSTETEASTIILSYIATLSIYSNFSFWDRVSFKSLSCPSLANYDPPVYEPPISSSQSILVKACTIMSTYKLCPLKYDSHVTDDCKAFYTYLRALNSALPGFNLVVSRLKTAVPKLFLQPHSSTSPKPLRKNINSPFLL